MFAIFAKKNISFSIFLQTGDTLYLTYIFPIVSVSVPLMDSCRILISVHGSRSAQDSSSKLQCQQHRIDDAAGNGNTVYGLLSLTVGIGFFHQCFEIKGLLLQI